MNDDDTIVCQQRITRRSDIVIVLKFRRNYVAVQELRKEYAHQKEDE